MFANDMKPDFCIRHTRREDASVALKEIYTRLPQQVMVPGPVLVKSSVPEPAGMNAAELGFFACHPTIPRAMMEAIRCILAVKVSSACCTLVNGNLLIAEGFPEDKFDALVEDRGISFFSEKDNALSASRPAPP